MQTRTRPGFTVRAITASPPVADRRSSVDGPVDSRREPALTSKEHGPELIFGVSLLSFSLG
jgi:hypothetical protein